MVRQALQQIEKASTGIALIVDDARHLLGTMTDGDARRAILNGLGLDAPVSDILARKSASTAAKPLTVPEGTPRERILRLMQERVIRHVPIVGEVGEPLAVLSLREVVSFIVELLPGRVLNLPPDPSLEAHSEDGG